MAEGGRISEWNEGAFKSTRLHEIQEKINYLRENPLGLTDGFFNYYLLKENLKSLYLEGYSKYKATERKEVDKLIDLADLLIELTPPTRVIKTEGFSGVKKSFTIDQENYKNLMKILLMIEMKVKDYNDAHGLTTMNREDDGEWD